MTNIARLDDKSWQELLKDLRERRVPAHSVHKWIVRLGKPYDAQRVRMAKEVVSMYLKDIDPWVRHEALWFLASWGKLLEFQPQVTEMLLHDQSDDNRGFAANCLGTLRAESCDPEVLDILRTVTLNESEVEQVRLKAYASMLKVASRRISPTDQFDFEIADKQLSDVDWNWVRTGK